MPVKAPIKIKFHNVKFWNLKAPTTSNTFYLLRLVFTHLSSSTTLFSLVQSSYNFSLHKCIYIYIYNMRVSNIHSNLSFVCMWIWCSVSLCIRVKCLKLIWVYDNIDSLVYMSTSTMLTRCLMNRSNHLNSAHKLFDELL